MVSIRTRPEALFGSKRKVISAHALPHNITYFRVDSGMYSAGYCALNRLSEE